MRRFLRKKHFERIEYTVDLLLTLREYPVIEVLAAYIQSPLMRPEGEILEPDFYKVLPGCGSGEDMPYSLALSPALKRVRFLQAIKFVYNAGYSLGKAPPDLASACLELAAWNMNRYKGRRIGMSGNVRGSGRDGEHFELSMPENVRSLLEPYRRKTI
jgi:hypothetical protein